VVAVAQVSIGCQTPVWRKAADGAVLRQAFQTAQIPRGVRSPSHAVQHLRVQHEKSAVDEVGSPAAFRQKQ